MKKLFISPFIVLLFLLVSCDDRKTTYHLTEYQKSILSLIHPGDVVIWESNTGIKDTAIVMEFIYDEAVINQPGSFDKGTWGERITVNYAIFGKNKLGCTIPVIRITADGRDNLIENTFTCGGYRSDSIAVNKKIGDKKYSYVFWRLDGSLHDTIFWNPQGYLGSIRPNATIKKIR